MTEQVMLSKDAFIDFILDCREPISDAATEPSESALPEGFEGFDDFDTTAPAKTSVSSFARRLLEASGFGYAELVQRGNMIRSTDAVARYLPDRVSFWPKTTSRSYQTLLFEANLSHKELLAIPAFRGRKMNHLDIVEDALARLVSEALEGFQRGGEGVTADVRKGRKEETLCVVSILDEREGQPVRLVCFGTQNKVTNGLETFQITEQTRFWDSQLAREHLGLLYERQFKKLEGPNWQEAFTTTEERKQAESLLEVCMRQTPKENDIQESVLNLLDTIAKGFGLRRKPKTERRLQAFSLPPDHDIGIDPEERENSFGGHNPFGGVTLRDERSRLLGYIIYPLKSKTEAVRLRKHLERNNRFHNVLVVYPDAEQTSLELWQGAEQLTGKLRKGQGYRDAADVVNLLSRFFVVSKAKVKNPTELAQELAYRARYLRRIAVKQLEEEQETGPLRNLYTEFKKALVHDQKEEDFADAFSQTLTYSLLTARWVLSAQGSRSIDRFTRKAAMQRLSIGSRFLGDMFDSVLAMQLEDRARLLWLVDDIADLLDRIDIVAVFKPDGTDLTADPIIHFYEPFLQVYDARVRIQRGAFYTPQPIVAYIVRSIHELLQIEFGLSEGLADTTTWGEMLKKHPGMQLPPLTDEPGEKRTISPDEPFVQILDPATGTGTFLVEVIDVIHRTLATKWKQERLTAVQQRAAWNDYVPRHLLPRLCAYEIMMAPYAIAHMKIGLKLAETGYHFGTETRINIYLTNALEPWMKQLPLISFDALSYEAEVVNEIKRCKRFTVIIGNPPYSVNSANKKSPIDAHLTEYKRNLSDERNLKPLNDDYVKFFRFSHLIVKRAGSGLLGMITNHSYTTARLFRAMRLSLLQDFQRLRFLDLRGDANRDPQMAQDKNVFDIQQGVGISVFSRMISLEATSPQVHRYELRGQRQEKYSWLGTHSTGSTPWIVVNPIPKLYSFKKFEHDIQNEYEAFLPINRAFNAGNVGYQTHRDNFVIDYDLESLVARISSFRDARGTEKQISEIFGVKSNTDWSVPIARKKLLQDTDWKRCIKPTLYRPFDLRQIFYASYVIDRDRRDLMRHMLSANLGLLVSKVFNEHEFTSVLATKWIAESKAADRTRGSHLFPLRLIYSAKDIRLEPRSKSSLTTNLSDEVMAWFKQQFGMRVCLNDSPAGPMEVLDTDVFGYFYAILHSPAYRSRYAEFLKNGFPRIPMPKNLALFRDLARFGNELVALHVLESPKLSKLHYEFIGGKDPEIEKITWGKNIVWLDKKKTCGFRGVAKEIWNFHIGGYKVCEKWLKERKGRILSKNEIKHYQGIVTALSETIHIMKEIDEVIEKHGGWPGGFIEKVMGGDK